jgi:hypothetical protein
MQKVSRWFTLVSAVAVSLVAAGCGSESMSGPSEVVSGARTEELAAVASMKATAAEAAVEVELVGFVKSVSAPNLTVGGRTVVTTKATEIKRNKTKVPFGSIKVGDHIKVQGVVRADGKVQAREIKVGYKGGTPNTILDDSPGHHNGTDDGPNHDAGDDDGGNGNDDGPNHDAGDDHGGNGDDDPADDDAGDDNGNHGAGHD